MRIHRQFGIFGAGVVACASSFCLLAAAGRSQTSDTASPPEPTPEQESWTLPSPTLSLQQLHDQHEAVLNGLDLINRQTEAAFTRYALSIDSKLDAIQQAFSAQRRQESDALHRSHRLMLTITLGLMGVSILGIVLMALLPVRAVNRLAAGVRAAALAHAVQPGPWPAWVEGSGLLPGAKESESASARLQVALERLEKRLLAMEGAAARPQIEEQAPPDHRVSKSARVPARASPAVAKSSATPHVALALGEGESLFFLPQDRVAARFRPFKKLWPKIQRFFVPPRPGKRS